MRHDLKEGDAIEFGGVQIAVAEIRAGRVILESSTVIKKVAAVSGGKLKRRLAPMPNSNPAQLTGSPASA